VKGVEEPFYRLYVEVAPNFIAAIHCSLYPGNAAIYGFKHIVEGRTSHRVIRFSGVYGNAGLITHKARIFNRHAIDGYVFYLHYGCGSEERKEIYINILLMCYYN